MPTQSCEEPVAETAGMDPLRRRQAGQNGEVRPGSPLGRKRNGQVETLRNHAADPREKVRNGLLKLQPGEPHDRHQGATNLEGARWSKPSQSGRTTRAERIRKVAAPDRRWRRAKRAGSSRNHSGGSSQEQRIRWEWTLRIDVDGEAIFDNPMRGVLLPIPFHEGRPSGQPEGSWKRR